MNANYTRQQQTHFQSSQIANSTRILSNSFVSLPLLSHLIHFECVFIYVRSTLILFEVGMQTIFSLQSSSIFLFPFCCKFFLAFAVHKDEILLVSCKEKEDKNAKKANECQNSWQYSLGNCCKWNKNNYFSVDVDYYHALAWEWTFRQILYVDMKNEKIKHVLCSLAFNCCCDFILWQSKLRIIYRRSFSRRIPKPISK